MFTCSSVCLCLSVYYSDNWCTFTAYSNVMWIHYLIDKLMKTKTSTSTDKSRQQNMLHRQLRYVHRELLDYSSTVQLITDCAFFL